MKKMAATSAIVFGILSLLVYLPTKAIGAQDTVVIKIGTLAPEGSSWVQTLNAINEEVSKKTANGVNLRIYPGGVLGDERDMLRKMVIGQIQGAALTSSSLSAIFNELDVFQIPFLFRNHNEVDEVIEKMDAFFRKGLEDNGYILAGWSEGGFVYLMSTVPVDTLDKLKKAKVWIWADAPMAKIIFNEAGISGIPLSVPDVLVGLQTGLVDVVYAPPSVAIALQWFTKIRYITDVPLIYLVGGVVIKKDVIQSIPAEQQQVLLESFRKHLEALKLELRKENQEALQVMVKHGAKLLKPTVAQVKEFQNLSAQAVNHAGNESFSKKIREKVEGYLKAYRGEN
jgi:TRAP-type C4-dicarboxylate transport system substrate-binding protein